MTRRYDLVIIGGGLTGAALAWGAARAGADTLMLDGGDRDLRASQGNFGLVWLQGKGLGHPAYMHWSLTAGRLWPQFAETLERETGIPVGWRGGGGLHFCLSAQEFTDRRMLIQQTAAQGGDIDIRLIGREALKTMLPQVGPQVFGASMSNLDGEANPLLLLRALHAGFIQHGGVGQAGYVVQRIVAQDAGFALYTDNATVYARRVVLCAGLGITPLARQLGMNVPLRPERGQIVVTDRIRPFLPYPSNQIRQTREGTILLGSSHDDAGLSTGTDVQTIGKLCHLGCRIFPALRQARVVRAWGAARIITPDGLPVYDEAEKYPGAYVITCHSGVTLASVHALCLGASLARGTLGPAPTDMRSTRFAISVD
ncbi:NAD(P)/FAD-dependent oxidoreductase [Sodalis sp. RH21]|uniref:NAD(P)/FAD-dependent oxidoreductase n=1 Tax=unclassified Sodalis (in: enterobacteria) TaxID=2636512 RepID=UPI0039B5772F